jgi:hypothetical protein
VRSLRRSTKQAQFLQIDNSVTVENDGTFQKKIIINTLLQPKTQHMLYVLGQDGTLLGSQLFHISASPPCITIDQAALPFTAQLGQVSNPSPQTLTVKNCGDTGTVITSVSTNDGGSWLSTTGGGQLNASGQLMINVAVNSQSMAAGSYTGHVIVTLKDANGLTTTQQVNVSLYIQSPPSGY